MKILILGTNQINRYNWGHELFKNEVAKKHDVRFYGDGYSLWNPKRLHINSIIEILEFVPDVILSYMGKYCKWISGLVETKIPKVHYAIDYFPWTFKEEDDFINRNKINMVLTPCNHEVAALKRRGHYNAIHLPFSIDIDKFKLWEGERTLDIMGVFSVVPWAYPRRQLIIDTLYRMKSSGFISGTIRESWPKTRVWHDNYIRCLQDHRIVINGVDKFHSLNWKFLEACACGSMLLTERAEGMEKMGFHHGNNCVVFNGVKDLIDKINIYLKDSTSRVEIATSGANMVRKLHSCYQRGVELTDILKRGFEI